MRALALIALCSCSLSYRVAIGPPPRPDKAHVLRSLATPQVVDFFLTLAAFEAAILVGNAAETTQHWEASSSSERAGLIGFTALAVGIYASSVAVNYDPPPCPNGVCQRRED